MGRLKDKLPKRISIVLEPRDNYEANFSHYQKKRKRVLWDFLLVWSERKLIKTGRTIISWSSRQREFMCKDRFNLSYLRGRSNIYSSDSFIYFQVFKLEKCRLFFLQRLGKTFLCTFTKGTNVLSWAFSITIVPPSAILWPYSTMSGNASCKHLSGIILLCLWRKQRSEILIFIPGRLQGNLGNEPAKKRESSCHGSWMPASYHFQPLHRANTWPVFSAAMMDWRFPIFCDWQQPWLRWLAEI